MPRRLSARSIALVVVLGLGAASCVPPEPDEGVVEHPPTSRIGELQAEGAVGRVIAADGVEACRAPFEDGQIDAVTAPDLLLLSLLGAIEGTALVGER